MLHTRDNFSPLRDRAWLAVAGLLFLALLATGCRSASAPRSGASSHTVLDYNNGWYHPADGFQTIRQIAAIYDRDPDMLAHINKAKPETVQQRGSLVYVPPGNDPVRINRVLARVMRDPSIVPRTPWEGNKVVSGIGGSQTTIKSSSRKLKETFSTARAFDSEQTATKKTTVAKAGTPKKTSSKATKKVSQQSAAPVRHKLPSRSELALRWPLRGEILREFKPGWTDNPSHGIEIAANAGSEVRSAAPGKVLWASDKLPGYGNLVIIDHGQGIATYYGYNERLLVREGDYVDAQQQIAKVGRPSKGSKPRLYFKVSLDAKPVDPQRYLIN